MKIKVKSIFKKRFFGLNELPPHQFSLLFKWSYNIPIHSSKSMDLKVMPLKLKITAKVFNIQ
jgi:hypothetical protein